MSAATAASQGWLTLPRRNPRARLRLLCLPYAGSSAAVYSEWPAGLPPWVEVAAVQIPGRLGRGGEPFDDLGALVAAAVEGLRGELEAPYAVWGHSMGALVAFELVRALRAEGAAAPVQLFVSGYPGPSLPRAQPAIHHLEGDAFVEALASMSWARAEVVEDRDVIDFLAPTFRADIRLVETYRYREEEPLEMPITAFGGRRDDEAPKVSLEAWARETSAGFGMHLLPGGHFFVETARPVLLEILSRALTEARERSW